ncbi:MAG: hypothetical protein LLF76_00815 [Planctomycetaceae bacterium]|nr:hypothetical protein [Planctomycetaceae bacterium]
MSSRTLVHKALEFEGPARIPRQMGLLPWATIHHPDDVKRIQRLYPDDICGPPFTCSELPITKGDMFAVGTYEDEWGCVWENEEAGIVGQVKDPIVQTWDDISRVRIPRQLLTIDIDQVNAFCRQTDKFVIGGCCPRPFERMQFIRGCENTLLDLASGTPEFFDLLGRVHAFYVEKLELWARTEVDALWFMDDWGSQQSLLISPTMWRRVFKPLYKDYIDIAHRHGKKAMMHSDGFTMEIIGDLAELGLDALNAQLFCMDIEELGLRFKGKITFWGEMDRQHLLPEGRPDEIVAAVKRVYNALYQNGGVIGQSEFGARANPRNVELVFRTWDSMPA